MEIGGIPTNMEIDLICGNICKMDLDKQIKLGHLLLSERTCRVCGEEKNLIDGFYRIRKDRGSSPSSYAYECKVCTIRRVISTRKKHSPFIDWQYPDW